MAPSMSSMTRLSVSSSFSFAAGAPARASASRTRSTKSACRNWLALTLMARRNSRVRESPAQSLSREQAASSTHWPIGRISPVSSARGMNSPGETRPRSGQRQRSSASAPTTPPAPSTCGLIMQDELAIVNGEPQSGLQNRRGGERALHLGVEEAQHVAPRRFRLIHRDVGLLEQFVERIDGVDEQRDADARSAVMQAPSDGVGLIEHGQNPLADLLRLRAGLHDALVQFFEEHDELVAAEAGGGVAVAHAAGDPSRDLDQQLVARIVASGLVEDLEVVDTDKQKRPLSPAARAADERLLADGRGRGDGWATGSEHRNRRGARSA